LRESKQKRTVMDRKSMKLVAVAGLSALCACAGLSRDARQEPLERFDEHGVGTAVLKVEAGHVLQFVNADARPRQIYSNDCGELSSAVLTPGATYAVEIGTGPKAVPPSGSARAALHRLLGRDPGAQQPPVTSEMFIRSRISSCSGGLLHEGDELVHSCPASVGRDARFFRRRPGAVDPERRITGPLRTTSRSTRAPENHRR
jgi:hypothetical protein